MYVPEKFAETDRAVLLDGEPGSEKLVAHMARANPHWQCFANSGADSE
jgi:predicted FMN-binding regulatory protein PaiB